MHPRLRIDLGWGDLCSALCACLLARSPARRAQRVEQLFSAGDALACLSARSGFELYLRALALPVGSEVLVSGLTIPHMPEILASHGLRVVPFALDPLTLAPAAGEIERRASARTRAVLFAHLFGQRADLGELAATARREGWLLWEDCAQAYSGDGWRGHAHSDVALFSFGLIKTATAVQGGILRVRDDEVRARMRALQADWPRQARADFLRRVCKAGALHALSRPALFALFARLCRRRGEDLDALLHGLTRGFPGPDFLVRLRRTPSAPLLALLERRLRRPQASHASARRAFGEALLARLGPRAEVFGRAAAERHHWVFTVGSDEPLQLVRVLRGLGFDATARSSLIAVAPGGGGEAPAASRRLLERLVYVPIAPGATRAQQDALAHALVRELGARELVPAGAPRSLVQPGG